MDEFLDFVSNVMEVDKSDLTPETEYKTFTKWDSLMMMNLIMEIEEEYDVQIPLEKIGRIKNLKDLYDLITNEAD